jgi:pyruvate formate lyase activating enzyme
LSERYARAAGVVVDVTRIRRTINLLLEGKVAYEFRTTVVPGLLGEADVAQIAQAIRGASRHCLQQFVAHNTLDPEMRHLTPYPADRIRAMADLARQWVDRVEIRGL